MGISVFGSQALLQNTLHREQSLEEKARDRRLRNIGNPFEGITYSKTPETISLTGVEQPWKIVAERQAKEKQQNIQAQKIANLQVSREILELKPEAPDTMGMLMTALQDVARKLSNEEKVSNKLDRLILVDEKKLEESVKQERVEASEEKAAV